MVLYHVLRCPDCRGCFITEKPLFCCSCSGGRKTLQSEEHCLNHFEDYEKAKNLADMVMKYPRRKKYNQKK